MSRRAWLEVACVLLGVASFIALADLATTETRPLWDGRYYRNLALHGYGGELLAPFAYRPGMPFLARWPEKIKAGRKSDHISAFWDMLPTMAELIGQPVPKQSDGISILPTLLGKTGEQKQHEYLRIVDDLAAM